MRHTAEELQIAIAKEVHDRVRGLARELVLKGAEVDGAFKVANEFETKAQLDKEAKVAGLEHQT
jgi:hypothetical protein